MNIAFFGTGILGFPMAEQLIKRGHQLCIYNRTKKKCAPLAKKGARLCDTPTQALADSRVLIVVLTDHAAIDEVLFKKDIKSFAGKTVIQMSTIGAKESQALQQKIRTLGGDYLECPVLGSRAEAASACP